MRLNAERVKRERQDRGWTQEQLAGAAGISLRTVQRIEAQAQASNESVAALCAVFGVQRTDLVAPAAQLAAPGGSGAVIAALVAGMVVGALVSALVMRWLG